MKYKGIERYSESPESSVSSKRLYLDSIMSFIEKKKGEAREEREGYISPEKLFEAPERYREELASIIGLPREREREVPGREHFYLGEDGLSSIYRVSINTIDGIIFSGLLMIPKCGRAPYPLVIAQHGGGGTPEFAADMYSSYGGNSYAFFTERALERGMAVFAPCLLLWRFGIDTGETRPSFDIHFDRDSIDRKLRQLGMSIMGLEIYNIIRSIDLITSHPSIDSRRVGMMGLSYGGFFSLYTAALDTRIKSIYSAAAFNDRSRVALSDWMWQGQSLRFHDAEAVGLCVPRNIVIDVGRADRVFDCSFAAGEAERARKYYEYAAAENAFYFNLWEGGHTFDTAGESFERFFSPLEK